MNFNNLIANFEGKYDVIYIGINVISTFNMWFIIFVLPLL